MIRHSWEAEPSASDGLPRHSWELEDPEEPFGGDPIGESDSKNEATATTAGEDYVDYMVGLYLCRTLSARDFCVSMFLAGNSGIEEAKPLGFRPDAPTGHYQRHLQTVFPWLQAMDDLYTFSIPTYSKDDLARSTYTFPMLPAHEALERELEQDPTVMEKLHKMIEARDLPDGYFTNPIVQNSATPVVPLSLFIDGAPYSQSDSVVGYWLTNEVTNQRHLLGVWRKKLSCLCGCRNWCSHFCIFKFLHWCFAALASGFHPRRRHDGLDWAASDGARARAAGSPLSARACLIWIKGDWAEYSTTLGFPGWNDSLRPCYGCNCSIESMHRIDSLSLIDSPWRANEDDDYFASCAACELVVSVTREQQAELLRLLHYDRRQAGSRGRALTAAMPALGLLAGDRLEPSEELFDVGRLEEVREWPKRLTFWRSSRESMTRHRNPLFDKDLGITPWRSLTMDTLHTVYLGVMQAWCKTAIWFLIDQKVFSDAGTVEERLVLACLLIKHELKAFYREHHTANPGIQLTRIPDFSKRVLGESGDRKLRTKAAQTHGFCLYLVQKLGMESVQNSAGPDAKSLLQAGEALVGLVQTWSRNSLQMNAATVQQCLDFWKRHLRCTQAWADLHIPKRHLMFHLICRSLFFGNPRRYAVWEDEGLNRELKKHCRTVSQRTFESFLLLRMRETLRRGVKRGRD